MARSTITGGTLPAREWRHDRLGARHRAVRELAEEAGDDERDLLADVDGVVADALDRAGDEHHRHRPLAGVVVLADLDRELEALLVEVVDDIVLADEVAGEGDVAPLER